MPHARNGRPDLVMDSSSYDDDEKHTFTCLFCPHPAPTLQQFHIHLTTAHTINLPHLLAPLPFYQRIRLVNYCRARSRDGFGVSDVMDGWMVAAAGGALDEDETLLVPVLEDDAVLISLDDDEETGGEEGGDGMEDEDEDEGEEEEDEEDWDEEDDEEDAEDEDVESTRERMLRETKKQQEAQERKHQKQQPQLPPSRTDSSDTQRLKRENAQQRQQVEQLTEALAAMQAALQNLTVTQTAQPAQTQPPQHDDDEKDNPPPLASPTNGTSTPLPAVPSASSSSTASSSSSSTLFARRSADVDAGYFGGYSTRHIHELMLKDRHRTMSYQSFLYDNPHLLKDKVVLDVGCGTGILSLFAAKAGARLVVGVDAADIADKAREIVALNGYEDRVVIVKGRMEDVKLPVDKVDVIISEWMGYFLLYESMLPSVLFARDRYLSNPAHCYPDVAVLYIAGMHDRRSQGEWIDWWKDVYGFNMTPLVTDADRHRGSSVETVHGDDVITSTCELQRFDVGTVRADELDWTSEFNVQLRVADTIEALAVHFDTLFQRDATAPVTLTTSPASPATPPTHWMQTVFRLHAGVQGEAGEGMAGVMEAKRLKRYVRGYGVKLVYWKVDTAGKEVGQRYVQEYTIE